LAAQAASVQVPPVPIVAEVETNPSKDMMEAKAINALTAGRGWTDEDRLLALLAQARRTDRR
jgi:hypothetical protein